MSKELTIHGEALGASQQGTLAVEQFLKDNYLFRFNELSGKVECVTLPSDDKPKEGEQGVRMKSGEIVSLIRREYPSIKNDHSRRFIWDWR